jgi:hypothetical protein
VIDELIFEWAQKTPRKTALLYNERALSYRALAKEIALARAYFIRRGYLGPGYAVLAFRNLLDFWIFGPALRSLGLTTVAVGSAAELAALPLTRARCVITPADEASPDLARVCAVRGWKLLSMSLKTRRREAAMRSRPPASPAAISCSRQGRRAPTRWC